MVDKRCSKKYTKPFKDHTDGYPNYRRKDYRRKDRLESTKLTIDGLFHTMRIYAESLMHT